jgi:hypothetical protein
MTQEEELTCGLHDEYSEKELRELEEKVEPPKTIMEQMEEIDNMVFELVKQL